MFGYIAMSEVQSAEPIGSRRVPRIYTVRGVTDNLSNHADRYGITRQLAWARIFERHWTVEQALGLEPPPARKCGRQVAALLHSVPLAPVEDIVAGAVLGLLTAEEYLHLEGVAPNAHPLSQRTAFEEETL